MQQQTRETIGALSGAFLAGVLTASMTRDPVSILFAISVGAGLGGGAVALQHERAEKTSAPQRRLENT